MTTAPYILAIETSCDETAVSIIDPHRHILASEISTQIPQHIPHGGVVPEIASRSHLAHIRPLIHTALTHASLTISQIGCFAATAGPGLASSLLIGHTIAKSLALTTSTPFLPINHMEGHLLSPFISHPDGVQPGIALIVSGGHTMLLHLHAPGHYTLLGRTLDDAAGEAFDKGGKMLGLPYPAGPHIDHLARTGDPTAFPFPRSMLHSGDADFSFSGLKTSLLYTLQSMPGQVTARLPDLCASYQEAIIQVLLAKTLHSARQHHAPSISVSGGVSCNSRLRTAFTDACQRAHIPLHLAQPTHSTDNAAMIAYAAHHRYQQGHRGTLTEDIHPNLPLIPATPNGRARSL